MSSLKNSKSDFDVFYVSNLETVKIRLKRSVWGWII